MCLAVPGKIKSIKENKAVVDYDGLQKIVDLSLVNAKVGDYVIANAGFAIRKISSKEAKEAIKLFQEIASQD